MRKKSLLPKSKAKNAYELLEEVCRLIREEPERYYQGWWRITQDFGLNYLKPGMSLPPCGTVCCVAGWICTLKSPKTYAGFLHEASSILGLDPNECFELSKASAVAQRTSAEPQTREYAEAGVAHIREFMAKHEAQLRAKKV